MSNRAQRRRLKPRPNPFPEHLRQQFADVPHVLNRDQSMQLVIMLAAQLEQLLNGDQRMPWVTSSIDKRSDGFSLHVQVVEPSGDVDVEVV